MITVRNQEQRLYQYRLKTGEITESDGAGKDEPVVKALQPMLHTGAHLVAGTEGWTAETEIKGTMLTASINTGSGPLVRLWVVLDGRDLRHLVPPPRVLDLPTPVCVIDVLQTLPYDPVVGGLQDLVDVLAWAWLRHVEETAVLVEEVGGG